MKCEKSGVQTQNADIGFKGAGFCDTTKAMKIGISTVILMLKKVRPTNYQLFTFCRTT
ncbi:hypothetical protein GBN63_20340 [Pectobacterium carotovorum]|nr:hypothetical protein GBN63_20340 [Pectobacterium carotovorum]